MPRPKGSKNKAKVTVAQVDFEALIAEKAEAKCHSPRKMRIECPVDNSVSHE